MYSETLHNIKKMDKELVSVEWLRSNLLKEKIVILDSSPKSTVGGKTSPYHGLFIPNSRILNIKENFTNIMPL